MCDGVMCGPHSSLGAKMCMCVFQKMSAELRKEKKKKREAEKR
jgi:hypothetical protein